MKILRIITRLNVGGPAKQVIGLCERIPDSLLIYGKSGCREGDVSRLIKGRSIKIPGLRREICLFEDLKALYKIRQIIKAFKPDIVHTHTAKAGFIGRLAALTIWKRPKLVHTFHGHVFHSYFGPVKTKVFIWAERQLARFTDRIIAISPSQKHDLCKRYRIANPDKVEIVRLGFDLSEYKKDNKMRTLYREKFLGKDNEKILLIGSVGRLVPIKNHILLLEAIAELDIPYKLLIVGDGELRIYLETLVDLLHIKNKVIFLGIQKSLVEIYNSIDVLVLTSKNEGTPACVIEAMAMEVPIISTYKWGVEDILPSVKVYSLERLVGDLTCLYKKLI